MNLITLIFLLPFFAQAQSPKAAGAPRQGPCAEKRMTLQKSNLSLNTCIKSWMQEAQADGSEPNDNCQNNLNEFVESAKKLKSCRSQTSAPPK